MDAFHELFKKLLVGFCQFPQVYSVQEHIFKLFLSYFMSKHLHQGGLLVLPWFSLIRISPHVTLS